MASSTPTATGTVKPAHRDGTATASPTATATGTAGPSADTECECDGLPNGDSHPHTIGDGHPHTDADRHARTYGHANGYAGADRNANRHAGTHGHADRHTGTDGNANGYAGADRHADGYTGTDGHADRHAGTYGHADRYAGTHRHATPTETPTETPESGAPLVMQAPRPPTATPTPTPIPLPGVRLSEVLPAPRAVDWDRSGAANVRDEWIELYNGSGRSVNIGGWSLDLGRGRGRAYRIPRGTSAAARGVPGPLPRANGPGAGRCERAGAAAGRDRQAGGFGDLRGAAA